MERRNWVSILNIATSAQTRTPPSDRSDQDDALNPKDNAVTALDTRGTMSAPIPSDVCLPGHIASVLASSDNHATSSSIDPTNTSDDNQATSNSEDPTNTIYDKQALSSSVDPINIPGNNRATNSSDDLTNTSHDKHCTSSSDYHTNTSHDKQAMSSSVDPIDTADDKQATSLDPANSSSGNQATRLRIVRTNLSDDKQDTSNSLDPANSSSGNQSARSRIVRTNISDDNQDTNNDIDPIHTSNEKNARCTSSSVHPSSEKQTTNCCIDKKKSSGKPATRRNGVPANTSRGRPATRRRGVPKDIPSDKQVTNSNMDQSIMSGNNHATSNNVSQCLSIQDAGISAETTIRTTKRPRQASKRLLVNLGTLINSKKTRKTVHRKATPQTDPAQPTAQTDLTHHALEKMDSDTETIQKLLQDLKTICDQLEEAGKGILVLLTDDERCQWWGSAAARDWFSNEEQFVQRFFNHCKENRTSFAPKNEEGKTKKTSKTSVKPESKLRKSRSKQITKAKRKGKRNTKTALSLKTSVQDLDKGGGEVNLAEESLKVIADVVIEDTDITNDISGPNDNEDEITEINNEDEEDDNTDPAGDGLLFKKIFTEDNSKHHCTKCQSVFVTQNQLASHHHFHPSCESSVPLNCLPRRTVLNETIVYVDPDLRVEVASTYKNLLDSQTAPPFQCLICKSNVTRRETLFRHLLTHNKKMVFPCNICSKQYKCIRSLCCHLKVHFRRPFSCLTCERVFRSESGIFSHKGEDGVCNSDQKRPDKKTEVKDSLQCYVCEFMTEFSLVFQSHVEDHIKRGETECQACFKKFPVLEEFLEHMKTEQQQPKPFLCACGKAFKDKIAYKRHQKIHEEPKFKCEECGKLFHERCNLRAHQRCHDGVKPYVCDFCGASYSKKMYFENHRRLHTGDRPFKCDFEGCEKTFRGIQSLTQHKRTHCKTGSFICDICGRTFKQPGHLNHHRKNHTIEWRWPCNYCPEKFKSCWSYKRHLANHHGDKKEEIERTTNIRLHECPVCKKMYHDMEDMRRHMNNHSGIKPFTCDICNKSFSDRSNLTNHKFIHSDRKKLKCSHCYKMFIHQSNLTAHVEKHHPDEVTGQATSTVHMLEQGTNNLHVFM